MEKRKQTNNMERVLHIFSSLNLAGAESRVMDLYRTIDKRKLQFDFITVKSGPYFYEEEIKKMGGRIFCITDPSESLYRNIKDMIYIMKNRGPYIAVHSHTSYYNGIAMYSAFRAKIKRRISHARNSSNNNLNIIKWIQVIIGRILIKFFATNKVAISKPAAKFIFGTTKKVQIIPNAINIDKFLENNKKDQRDLKNKLKLEGSKILLMVARFIEFKNHKFAIDVLEELVKNRKLNYKLILAGEGKIEEELKEYVKQKGLESNILFLGLRTDIAVLDKVADLFLVPSKFEGLCGACIEAQAAGTKCLLSKEVPEEADMGIGLIFRESIHKGPKLWADKIDNIINKEIKIDNKDIVKNFKNKKFTLKEEKKEILELYGME